MMLPSGCISLIRSSRIISFLTCSSLIVFEIDLHLPPENIEPPISTASPSTSFRFDGVEVALRGIFERPKHGC